MTDKFVELDSSFLELIFLDEYLIGHNGFIAGGCFKDIFYGKNVKDLDIFFHNENDMKVAVDYFKNNNKYKMNYKNKNATSFLNKETKIVLDLVSARYGTPTTVIDGFDFTITKFAYFKTYSNNIKEVYKNIYHKDYFAHLQSKKIVMDNTAMFPWDTKSRVERYIKYGYTPEDETLTRIDQLCKNSPKDESFYYNLAILA